MLRQIACADVILLNKIDLAEPDTADRLEKRIRGMNPTASLYRTSKAGIDIKHVIGIDAYAAKTPFVSPSNDEETCNRDHSITDHSHDRKSSHGGVSSIQVSCPPLNLEQAQRLDEWIRTALWEGSVEEGSGTKHDVEILRCKGLYSMIGQEGKRFVLQGVRNLYDISELIGKEEYQWKVDKRAGQRESFPAYNQG
jgi:G3E family GTPase